METVVLQEKTANREPWEHQGWTGETEELVKQER